MKTIAAMLVYNRINTVNFWLSAWNNSDHYDTKLVVIHNYDGKEPMPKQKENIVKWKPDYYWARPNKGQDIGALRDFIHDPIVKEYDLLFWCLDDNIPMRKDFLSAFIKPFKDNPKLGLLGNHWVKGKFHYNYKPGVPDHIRTTCFAIRREAAEQLKFSSQIKTKNDCYLFEWKDRKNNMTEQVRKLNYEIGNVYNDWDRCWTECSDYIWDIGDLQMQHNDPRCRKDHWAEYYSQFTEIKCSAFYSENK